MRRCSREISGVSKELKLRHSVVVSNDPGMERSGTNQYEELSSDIWNTYHELLWLYTVMRKKKTLYFVGLSKYNLLAFCIIYERHFKTNGYWKMRKIFVYLC